MITSCCRLLLASLLLGALLQVRSAPHHEEGKEHSHPHPDGAQGQDNVKETPPPVVVVKLADEVIPPSLMEEMKPEVDVGSKPFVEEMMPPMMEEIKPPMKEETKDPMKEEMNPPMKEETKDPMKEEMNRPMKEETKDPMMEEINRPMKEETKDHMKEETKDPMMEEINRPMKEETKDPMKEAMMKPPMSEEIMKPTMEIVKPPKGEPKPPKGDKTRGDSEDAEKESYEGAQLLRVTATTDAQKELLSSLEDSRMVDTWLRPAGDNTPVDVMVPAHMLDAVKKRLGDVNALYEVVITDVQKAIESENPALTEEELNELGGRKGHRMTFQSYHRVSDIHGYLDYLAQTYPDICTVSTIGSSVEGKPLKMLKISSGQGVNKPAFWIDGGIHAREWISPASVAYIIQELVENRESHGNVAEGVDYYILPVVNPDGYEYTHQRERLWRKNRANPYQGQCAGTDLNRNFGYKWGGAGSSKEPCKEIYAGPRAFSEPETSAIQNFVTGRASSIKAYVTFHSYGQYILYPWGYDYKVPPDYADLDRVGKQAAAAMRAAGGASYTVGNSARTLYPASGGADDWAKGGPRIKYTYTIELRDRGQYGFLLPAHYIVPTAKEAFAAVKTIAQAIMTA